MAYQSSQLDTQAERNRVNEALRASPQWRSAIQQMGLNPDGPLRLTGDQQRSLGMQLGLPLSDFHIDGAGNINDFHGWKGLPTWAKVAAIGGATAATLGATGGFGASGYLPGFLGGAGGGGGTGAALAGGAAFDAAPAGATGIVPGLAGAGGAAGYAPGAAAGSGGFLGGLKKVGNALIGRKTGNQNQGDQIANESQGGFDWTKLIPLGLASASAIRGATRGPTPGELALDKMMASAQNRVDTMEPTFQALAKMVQAQMPDYTKGQQ